MIAKTFSPPAVACALVAIVLAALTLGPFMRETDQAWLLDGGMGIANGHPEIARAEFNYDKQFVSYWLPGVLFKFLPRPFAADTLVLAGNLLGMLLLWGAMFWLLAKSSRRLPLALALPVILVPSFLVYSPFYASAFTSVAFVILLAAFLDRKKWNWFHHAMVFVLAFCAVGARADVILLLPLLAMLHSPRRTFISALRSPNTWLMAAGGMGAFLLGRALYLEKAIDYAPSSFRLKIYLGYIAFGLGGAAVVLLIALHAIYKNSRANHSRPWLVFLWIGLLLPMGYYSFQLLTPRHCTVGAVSVLIFVCAKRGRAIFQNYFRKKFYAVTVKTVFILSALAPVFLGLNLADIHHPKIICAQPTLLPTGAGVAPAGAYFAFAFDVRQRHGFLDHNHAVWAVAKSTRFEAAADGKVPYLFSPIESYLIFAIHLQGKNPGRYSLANQPCPDEFYVESRSLMRFQFVFPPQKVSMENFFARTAFTPVTEMNWHGITMLRGDRNLVPATNDFNKALWALNTAFERDEFRLENPGSLRKIPSDWNGKRLVIVGTAGLVIHGPSILLPKNAIHPVFGDLCIYVIPSVRAGDVYHVENAAPGKTFIGLGVFPEWMSLQRR
jgi:hypothetical protein